MSENGSRLPPDYHTHTELCGHAEGRPADYLRQSLKLHMEQMAATDHCPTPHGYDPENRMSMEDFERYREWVVEAQSAEKHQLLFGVEADFYAGCVSFQDEFLNSYPLDIVLGSVHFQSFWATDKAEQTLFDKDELMPIYRRYYKLVALMAECGLYDVVAHFDLPKKNGRKLPDEEQRKFVLPTLDRIARAGMAIEINTSGLRDKVGEIYPSPQILSWAHEREIPITFGSNAHSPGQVGADFDQAVALALEVGYTHYNSYADRIANPVPLNATDGSSVDVSPA